MAKLKLDWIVRFWKPIVWLSLLIVVGVVGTVTHRQWLPHAKRFMAFIQNNEVNANPEEDEAAEVGANADTLTLSPIAWKNIGLKTGRIELSDFAKVVSVPAMVVERPGRSQIEIAAPMTGIITKVYPLERQPTAPGSPLFQLRMTHEDVVTAQGDFLTRLQEVDVVNQELKRLQQIDKGVIAGKRIIEQEYKRDQAIAALATLRQSLLLHGLTESQVADIEKTRNLLKDVTVVAPPYSENSEYPELVHQYHVQSIYVNRGESVVAGQLLGSLADHGLLYIEGKAFEDDVDRLIDAAQQETEIKVVPISGNRGPDEVLMLKVQSVSDQIGQQSRALKFYLLLPNRLIGKSQANKDFVAWKYRPGQRMEVHIPTSDRLKNKVVLPPSAVVIDGPNAFVFEQNGENFDRIDVHVLYRDKESVVLENDGTLVGSTIAMTGAYRMHLALKNQSGGAIDPHAGHSH